MLLTNIIVLFGELFSILLVLLVFILDDVVNEDFLLKLTELFLLKANAPILRILLLLSLLHFFIAKLLPFVILVLLSDHCSARTVHDSHQGFLMASEIDFI